MATRNGALWTSVFLALCAAQIVWSGPHYGDPNQAYDRLPGTFETWHMDWATPLAGGKLNVLFIVPYKDSREVVELRQRLDLDYTVIMNCSRADWSTGYGLSNGTSIPNHDTVIDRLCRERLDLKKQYDAIVIGGISWKVIPTWVQALMLQHVERGTALVYVSPHRFQQLTWAGKMVEAPEADAQYEQLFQTGWNPECAGRLKASLPFDVMPFLFASSAADVAKTPHPKAYGLSNTAPFSGRAISVRQTHHGKGNIIVLDYHKKDASPHCDDYPLTADVLCNLAVYDLEYAVLAKCVLEAARGKPVVEAVIAFEGPRSKLPVVTRESASAAEWVPPAATTVFSRADLGKVTGVVKAMSHVTKAPPISLHHTLRNAKGVVLSGSTAKAVWGKGGTASTSVAIPALARGNYYLDLRVLDAAGKVMDFASRSFRVEDAAQIKTVSTDKDAYQPGEPIQGKVAFSLALKADQRAVARAVDTWGREVCRTAVALARTRQTGTFSLPVTLPLCRLWDVYVDITDPRGVVDSARTWVNLPVHNRTFDEFFVPFIFTAVPERYPWKGNFHTEAMRRYGINGANVTLIYDQHYQYELFERAHLTSVTYAEHLGEQDWGGTSSFTTAQRDSVGTEYGKRSMAELSRMLRHTVKTGGKPLDPKEFPYVWGGDPDRMDAGRINDRMASYRKTAPFTSQYFFIVGERHQSCEQIGRENSSFDPLTTRLFQQWCKEQYGGSLEALNAEWGSDFKAWDQVRGILLKAAAKSKQLPRWVAFRFFMRSRIWTQFWIDWTDMMRTVMGYPVRTATNGHESFDMSRFRDCMSSGKLYAGTCNVNDEYRYCVSEELRQSFSGDRSFLTSPHSMNVYDTFLANPLASARLAWTSLFAGYRGHDWEAAGPVFPTFGGHSCLTPDFSEPVGFFKIMSAQWLELQGGIGKLCNTAKPLRRPVAVLWSPVNHYISRLRPREAQGFTGGEQSNVSVDGGAISDCLVLMKNLRIRPTFVAPQDLANDGLAKRGFKALILPYNRGMGEAEASAIRAFVRNGGLVIATNEPGSYSRFGKKLPTSSVKDLFPVTDRDNTIRVGKGYAAYLPDAFNGYLARMETCDYAGSDSVAHLLDKYAGIRTPIELTDPAGKPRRDVLMPVYLKGSARYVGMLRAWTSAGKEPEGTAVQLDGKYHVWDARKGKYLGYGDTFKINLDMHAKFVALLPANPTGVQVKLDHPAIRQGQVLKATVVVHLDGPQKQIAGMGQVIHLEVFGPDGKELEWYRQNVVFDGPTTTVSLPISFSEKPGRYVVRVRNPITHHRAEAPFEVAGTQADARVEPQDLIVDGGFENPTEVNTTVGYFRKAVKDGIDLGGELFPLVPKMLNQFSGTKKLIIVEGKPGKEVHTGKYALRVDGSFYVSAKPTNYLLKVTPGDVYEFSCYAKGKGKLGLMVLLLDDAKKGCGSSTPPMVSVAGDTWGQVKQALEVQPKDARYGFLRFMTDSEVCVDDFLLHRASGN